MNSIDNLQDESSNEILIHCDGACSGNPGPGGWGAVLRHGKHIKEINGYVASTTNNRMELTAAIMALKEIKLQIPVHLFSDSEYLIKGMTLWINGWLRTNWKKGQVKNKDLWQELLDITKGKQAKWSWVRGHSGDYWNEKADALARLAISEKSSVQGITAKTAM